MKDDSKNVFSDKYSSNERWNIAVLKKEVEMFNLLTYFLKKKIVCWNRVFYLFAVFWCLHNYSQI